jgi:hypothetical protein
MSLEILILGIIFMKKHKSKQALKKIFNKPGFVYHDKIFDEITEIIVGSGKEDWFVRVFAKNLYKLEELGEDAIDGRSIERLKQAQGLCSLKMRCKELNLRLLFSFDKFQDKVMLHLFFERDDSTKDKYSTHIPIALERKKDLEGDFKNGK